MGGLALKNTFTRRYERAEFEVLSQDLLGILSNTFKRVAMPLFYKNKQSFGDADIILSMEGFNGNMRTYIEDTFSPNEIFHNGNCWSFDYKELQIDLITVAGEDFDSNYNYLSYNDLGNYIGKIAHGFGLKYGQQGLTYDHYFKGFNIGRVLISKDYDKIYEFLGLSYDRWKEGFNELEDIFAFISESPYFNWEYLQLENNNRVNRERDAKRKSYMSFLEYIEANCKDDNHRYQYEKDKTVYVNKVAEFFPESGIQMEIRRMEYEECKALYIKAKFNGGEVMRRFGLKGKDLGDALTSFKYAIEDIHPKESHKDYKTTFEEYVLETPSEEIYEDFQAFITDTF
jgi:hypothetical protein